MKLNSDPSVKQLIANYPSDVQKKLLELREMILNEAEEIDGLEKLEETLKWGEPSYLSKKGSTIRMDWKQKSPKTLALYFNCNTKLVATFRIIYKNDLKFEGNRAIVLDLQEKIPKKELRHCINMALNYHQIKKLPLLGA